MKKGQDLKPHIGIFGRRNMGKSSLINVITGQDVAIVSEQAGTTTDPVKKSVEIFGIGPAIVVDTAGIDDFGDLGEKRVKRSLQTIRNIDLAILVIAANLFGDDEINLLKQFEKFQVPVLIIHNKSDKEKINEVSIQAIEACGDLKILDFSTLQKEGLGDILKAMKEAIPKSAYQKPSLFEGILASKDLVLLITPIDAEAPEGRMILPQTMAWRDALDKDAICMSCKESELEDFLKLGLKPKLAVTDSQVFEYVAKVLPEDIPLTSFSILFARLKGNFDSYVEGTRYIDHLKDGDKVLILESCTHQVNCDDIGRYKIPRWLEKYSGKQLNYHFLSGVKNAPDEVHEFALIVQCGGCMATRKQILNRIKIADFDRVPITNYGMLIAKVNGIFEQVVEPLLKHV